MALQHKAVAVVNRTVELWETDKSISVMRANQIVCDLITAGHIKGSVKDFMALAPCDD